MNIRIDPFVKAAFDEIIEHTPDLGPTPDADHISGNPPESESRPWLAVAAVAITLVGVGGIALLADRPQSTSTSGSQSTSVVVQTAPSPDTSIDGPESQLAPSPDTSADGSDPELLTLSGRQEDLSTDEWVTPGQTPSGYHFMWGVRDASSRTLFFGDDAGNTINFDIRTDPVEPIRAEGVEIAGATWYARAASPGFAIAQRIVGDTLVSVSANGNTDVATLLTIVETLATVHEDHIPGDVLTPTPEAFVPVAMYDSADGTVDMSAYELNGKFCTQTTWTGSTSQTCVLTLDIDGVMSAVNGGGSMHVGGAPTMLVEGSGVVRDDVARVVIELQDGQEVEVIPTDLSGTFDTKFWLVNATLAAPPESVATPIGQVRPIVKVTAYDAAGQVLAIES